MVSSLPGQVTARKSTSWGASYGPPRFPQELYKHSQLLSEHRGDLDLGGMGSPVSSSWDGTEKDNQSWAPQGNIRSLCSSPRAVTAAPCPVNKAPGLILQRQKGVCMCVLGSGGWVLVTQSCLTLCNPMDCSPPGSSVLGRMYWTGLPFPSPGDLPNPGMEPGSPALQGDS